MEQNEHRPGSPGHGSTPSSHASAAVLKRQAQDALDTVKTAKRAAALKSAEADTFAANAARAKREGWGRS
jgi:hypothetical protein